VIDEVSAALARVLGHEVSVRADTPLSTFGPWPSIAVLVASVLRETTGVAITDASLEQAVTAGDLAAALGGRST